MVEKIFRRLTQSFLCPYKVRTFLLNHGGKYQISNSAIIKSGCYFEGNHIHIGENVIINHDCRFYSYNDETSLIQIEENVSIAMGVTICTHTHHIGGADRRAVKGTIVKPITIGKASWIGMNVTIFPGVKIGNGCIIAAGAVVIKDCIANGMYAGVPAKLIKILDV